MTAKSLIYGLSGANTSVPRYMRQEVLKVKLAWAGLMILSWFLLSLSVVLKVEIINYVAVCFISFLVIIIPVFTMLRAKVEKQEVNVVE